MVEHPADCTPYPVRLRRRTGSAWLKRAERNRVACDYNQVCTPFPATELPENDIERRTGHDAAGAEGRRPVVSRA